ncbi:MAG: hypothetical protein AAGE80_08805 [Pseudomonadota bacterium]
MASRLTLRIRGVSVLSLSPTTEMEEMAMVVAAMAMEEMAMAAMAMAAMVETATAETVMEQKGTMEMTATTAMTGHLQARQTRPPGRIARAHREAATQYQNSLI